MFKVLFLLMISLNIMAKDSLKVLLYSHVPTGSLSKDFDSIKKRIEVEFEALYPEIDLTVDMDNVLLDTYKVLNKEERKNGMISSEGYDLIEVDTLYIEKLVDQKLISKTPSINKSRYFDQSIAAVTVDGEVFGAPTMMCSYYLAHKLNKQSENITLGNEKLKISGMYSDSMVISLLYSALLSQFYPKIKKQFEQDNSIMIFEKMYEIIKRCREYKCTTKDYFYSHALSKTLTTKDEDAHDVAIAYSQILHYLKMKDKAYELHPFRFTKKAQPIFSLTNALVLNQQRCTDAKCLSLTSKFIDYYSSQKTLHWLSLNKDNPGFPPRYISPSIIDFYSEPEVRLDKSYQVIFKRLEKSIHISYPSLLKYRKKKTFDFIDFLSMKDKKYKKMKDLDLWVQDF